MDLLCVTVTGQRTLFLGEAWEHAEPSEALRGF